MYSKHPHQFKRGNVNNKQDWIHIPKNDPIIETAKQKPLESTVKMPQPLRVKKSRFQKY
jgi:hypothetical protein